MNRVRQSALRADFHVILTIEVVEVPGRGYGWRMKTSDGQTVAESPIFVSLQQCLRDARDSSALNPGIDPYTRRS